MPIGPPGQRRPADMIGYSTMIARVTTEEITETLREQLSFGGASRANKLNSEERSAIAKKATVRRSN